MPYCGNQWVAPGSVCSDGSRPTPTRGGAPTTPTTPVPEVSSKTPPGASSGGKKPPAQADVRPLVTSMKPPRPGLAPEPYMLSNVYQERENLNTMRVTDPQRYNRIVSELRATGLLGPRANSESSIDQAYKKLLGAAAGSFEQGAGVTPQQARNILAGMDGEGGAGPGGSRGRSGRAAAYDGPMESVQVAAETDIVAMAQEAAQELLGRAPTQAELDRILKRTRSAEQTQPTVQTRQGPGRVTTQEGLTREGRNAILKQVLMSSPDYAGYQIDSTMMDMFSNILSKGQAVARG